MMLRINWVVWRKISLLLVAFALASCGAGVTPSPVPTLTLISVTETPTPVPVTMPPSATSPSLLSPGDIVTPTTASAGVLIPEDARGVVELSIADLAAQLEVQPTAIELVRLGSAVWSSADLGCGDGRATPTNDLTIGGFRLTLAYEGDFYEYHTNLHTAVRQCDDEQSVTGRNEALLIERDPVAAELVLLAQSQLARQLDLATQRIRIVDITSYTWPDSSLGCPLEDQTYTTIDIPGYRILLEAGDNTYLFHSDSEQLLPCDLADEVLPD
ncbi:MAG: hypothetical protein K8L99_17850 [Anaerolineae bacterium]|nr:hypothetical protein [Anaerolineae bacterium]